jgi:hypothetical protein
MNGVEPQFLRWREPVRLGQAERSLWKTSVRPLFINYLLMALAGEV